MAAYTAKRQLREIGVVGDEMIRLGAPRTVGTVEEEIEHMLAVDMVGTGRHIGCRARGASGASDIEAEK